MVRCMLGSVESNGMHGGSCYLVVMGFLRDFYLAAPYLSFDFL